MLTSFWGCSPGAAFVFVELWRTYVMTWKKYSMDTPAYHDVPLRKYGINYSEPVLHVSGPELGPLAGLMVGPEQGGWQVDEITVVSSRTSHVDRFVLNQTVK